MNTATLGLYSVDPTALDTFHSFDPESFVCILAIADALIAISAEGEVVPALAVSWDQTSPVTLEMELRQGVCFHNGESFDADSVLATFHHHHHPTPSACGGGILAPITEVEKLSAFRIRITTAFPDAMLLRRLLFFTVYPAGLLEERGRAAIAEHPIGTGSWRYVRWTKGREIVLERNPDHWTGGGTIDRVRIPIVRQKEWVDRLARGELDVILNLDSIDARRARTLPDVEVASREGALSQWFLLANRGPLADVRVRRALNHAVKQSLIVDVVENGMGRAQHTVATPESFGHTTSPPVFRYSPRLARGLLEEAGYPEGFTLRGLVSETSTGVYLAVKEFLRRIGVTLEAEIVPRSQWVGRIVGGNLQGAPYDGDFAISIVDNPLLDSVFHQFIFFFSEGLYSLTRDADYDARFLKTATAVGDQALAARQDLECYAVEQALMLFTVQQHVHAAWRKGFQVPMPRSAHFDAPFWWAFDGPVRVGEETPFTPPLPHQDAQALIEATSHTGTFFLRPDHHFEKPWAHHLWRNLATSQERWHQSHVPMIRELVTQIEARNNLTSILSSTRRVGIVGYSLEGDVRFGNAGFQRMFGDETPAPDRLLDAPDWATVARAVDEEGSWLGPVVLSAEVRRPETPERLYLTATPAQDDEGAPMGVTLVFSDFSGEEERIRNQAIRTILDNVPYGLFVTDREGRLRSGSSEACRDLFLRAEDPEGQLLREVLGLSERDGANVHFAIEQVFDDWLPEEVTVAQIPARVAVGDRTLSLSASVVRNEAGVIDGLLFTAADISDLIEAEREVEHMRGTLQVLRFRDRFEKYVHEHAQSLNRLERTFGQPQWDQDARRELHTAKGVFGQFGLSDLQRRLHSLEDATTLTVGHIQEARGALRQVLDAHEEVWQIDMEETAEHFDVDGFVLADLERSVSRAETLEEAQASVRQLLQHIRSRRAASVLGPIQDSVQQLAERRGKQVVVEVSGAEHRLPPRLEPVFEQLGHLVRNAVDHGIELPEERGDKPSTASVRIEVVHTATSWTIAVEDDGKGIDPERVARKAIDLQLHTREEVERMSAKDKMSLMFADGLSTADEISETSGRGVGMAAVRATVEQLGGRLEIDSELGRGTRIALVVPNAA